MSEQGLTNRLRQKSRRTGLAVALSMALTIALCVGMSAWIYGKTEPWVSDFAGISETEIQPTEPPDQAASDENASTDNQNPTTQPDDEPSSETPTAQAGDQQPTITGLTTSTAVSFTASHRSNPSFSVNLRPGPSVFSGDPVGTLAPSTPLEFQGDQGQDEEGSIWLLMKTQDGLSGWIREVDTEPAA